ncbi:MAG: hypothetical protein AB8H12_06985 [Lewinella sp.]
MKRLFTPVLLLTLTLASNTLLIAQDTSDSISRVEEARRLIAIPAPKFQQPFSGNFNPEAMADLGFEQIYEADEVFLAKEYPPVFRAYSQGACYIVENATHNGIRHSSDAWAKVRLWAMTKGIR